ncbi:MAG: four helix bundle protein [Candidatus Nomurabacteria bacterium]|nr:four helix bundle protein [Candidatus Nomurabacteria bacterium]
MTKILSYKELIVWQKSYKLCTLIYKTTETFPKKEDFSLTSQMRRCSLSIPSNIAEGYNRNHQKEFIQFLQISYGSSSELETQILIASEVGYIDKENSKELLSLLTEVLKMLNAMMQKLKTAPSRI